MTRKQSEQALEQLQQNLEYQNQELKVFLADIVPHDVQSMQEMQDRMDELENLVSTYGGIVIVKHIQQRSSPDYATFIGGGKLEEIKGEMQQTGANILIVGNILKPKQIYAINEQLRDVKAKAWDRIDLILKIFERHAKSKEAKLQIELAAIGHMGPRIYDMGMELGKQGGKGKGETNTEIMKRHLQRRELAIKKDLKHFEQVRAEHRKSRSRKGITTIGIVGYTNAGKSTLTNALTKKGVLAEDKLFATLGTSVGKMFIPPKYDEQTGEYIKPREMLVNDTIGFIRDLPPELIQAFTSTLEDSIEADLLLHTIDASDPKLEEKIQIVDDILESIGAHQKKLYVFNKIDSIEEKIHKKILENGGIEEVPYLQYLQERFVDLNPVFVSAYKKIGMDDLREVIEKCV